MRPRATRQTDWPQLGMGACALVLPPLALGAALYSMLEPLDSDVMRPGGTDTVLPNNGQPAGGPLAGGQQLPAAPAEGRAPVRVVTGGGPVPTDPMPAVAANPPANVGAEGAATQSPPAAAPPKRSVQRNAQRHPQQQDAFKTWLQQIGLLPPHR